MAALPSKTREKTSDVAALLKQILQEVRLLRQEFSVHVREDTLEEYAHPDTISDSYQKALRDYPPDKE